MSDEQPKDTWHFFRDDDGTPAALNLETGEVAQREISIEQIHDYHQVNIDGNWYWVPVNLDPLAPAPRGTIKFSSFLADQVCRHLVEDKTLKQAAALVGITYYDLCKFRSSYPAFDKMLTDAKKYRAEAHFEKLVEIAQDTDESKDAVGLKRLQADVYKHVAATHNDDLNPKTKVAVDQRIGIVGVETGVRRDGDITPEEREVFDRIEKGQAGLDKGRT